MKKPYGLIIFLKGVHLKGKNYMKFFFKWTPYWKHITIHLFVTKTQSKSPEQANNDLTKIEQPDRCVSLQVKRNKNMIEKRKDWQGLLHSRNRRVTFEVTGSRRGTGDRGIRRWLMIPRGNGPLFPLSIFLFFPRIIPYFLNFLFLFSIAPPTPGLIVPTLHPNSKHPRVECFIKSV